MPHRLAVGPDGPHRAARHPALRQHGDRRVREPAAQVEPELAPLGRRGTAVDRALQSSALGGGVRPGTEPQQLRRPGTDIRSGTRPEPRDGGGDPIQ